MISEQVARLRRVHSDAQVNSSKQKTNTAAIAADGAQVPWRVKATVLLLGSLAVLVGLAAADRVLGLGLLPPPLTLQLRAAARAVAAPQAEQGAPDLLHAIGPGGLPMDLPGSPQFDRVQAVRLFMQLDALRAECEKTMAHLVATDYLQGPKEERLSEARQILVFWSFAQEGLGRFLAVEPPRAQLILAGLGWPWVGDGEGNLNIADFDPPFPAQPGSLLNLSGLAWHSLFVAAESEHRPWLEVRAKLAARYGLNEQQSRALEAYLCRLRLQSAFHSPAEKRMAVECLERLAALTPAQAQAVLAMAGTRELLNAGTFAFPVLIEMLEDKHEVALPLLHECVSRAGVFEQALRAAEKLGGLDNAGAERVLIALGPFGAEAIKAGAQRRGGQVRPAALLVLDEIRKQWPEGKALQVLGADAASWRRWYSQAKTVL